MISAGEIAKYIIKMSSVDNLKLQKLLYYSQAIYLITHDKRPLFQEEIEAWDYGPVVPSVYREYRQYGIERIPSPDETLPISLSVDEIEAVDMVLAYYGEMSGLELMNQTHRESPWRQTYKPGLPSNIISTDIIYDYYKKNIEFINE